MITPANLEQIKRFMQQQDPNGSWLDAGESDTSYMYDTLNKWVDDGLEDTPRVRQYMAWLRTDLSGGLW